MKKRFLIYVDIDTSRHAPSHVKPKEFGIHRIQINDDLGCSDAATSLAHELGHVVGREIGLPADKADPRNGASCSSSFERSSRIQDSEIEAWDTAYRILFRTTRDQCLATYGVQVYP